MIGKVSISKWKELQQKYLDMLLVNFYKVEDCEMIEEEATND